MNAEALTQEKLRERLHYCPETGRLTWKVGCRGTRVGSIAGSTDSKGYLCIRVAGKRYKAHRLAWLWVYGSFPVGGIDHINGRPGDNRICNLREATQAQNMANRKAVRQGMKGAYFFVRRGKWKASIRKNREQFHLGMFHTEAEAHAAYVAAAVDLHGDLREPNKLGS